MGILHCFEHRILGYKSKQDSGDFAEGVGSRAPGSQRKAFARPVLFLDRLGKRLLVFCALNVWVAGDRRLSVLATDSK